MRSSFVVSYLRVEQAPGHGADLVEALKCINRVGGANCTGMDQQSKVADDLPGGAVADSPVMVTKSAADSRSPPSRALMAPTDHLLTPAPSPSTLYTPYTFHTFHTFHTLHTGKGTATLFVTHTR